MVGGERNPLTVTFVHDPTSPETKMDGIDRNVMPTSKDIKNALFGTDFHTLGPYLHYKDLAAEEEATAQGEGEVFTEN